MLPAAKGTPQVPPTRIARMRQKANPALRAVGHAPQQPGMGLYDRVQRGLILPDKRPDAVELMPIGAKREKLLDGYGKKARLSVILAMVLDTPSSYLFDAEASRGRARFFDAPGVGICKDCPHKRSAADRSPNPYRLPSRHSPLTRQTPKPLLERRNPPSSFQVVRQFSRAGTGQFR